MNRSDAEKPAATQGKHFTVIADEAHSSQTGEAASPHANHKSHA